jgi:predicted MFS family arabinose efflux permease
VVPYERRGAATGAVMSSFSIASVLGIPAGMALANARDWHAPFFALALVSALVWGGALAVLPPLRGHLARSAAALGGHADRRRQGPVATLRRVFAASAHRRAFALIAALMLAGFSVVPFLSPYMVRNVGLTEAQLPYIYLAGGLATAVSSTVVGRLADRFGKPRVFTAAALASAPALVLLTTLPPVPVPVALLVTTLFMVLVNARLVPAFAMITASAEPGERGRFLSVNSAVQQMASGAAAYLGGLVVAEGPGGALRHYDVVGLAAAAATLLCVPLARRLRPAAGEAEPGDRVRAEGAAPGTPAAESAPGGATVPAATEPA